MTVNILGTPYKIIKQKEKDNPKLKDANGLCEVYAKKIILLEIEDDVRNYENIEEFEKKVLRHEIIHAFLAESGLRSNSDWAENEEMVDWIAAQFPKLKKVFDSLSI